MAVNTDELLALTATEKLRLVEMLWDDLGASADPIPLPEWVEREAARRRDEMLKDRSLGVGHDEVWRRIEQRHG